MSDYFESIKKKINGKSSIQSDGCEYYIYDDKKESCLCISDFRVTYKGYVVPLNESEVEDLYNLVSIRHSLQEEENKRKALAELKGE